MPVNAEKFMDKLYVPGNPDAKSNINEILSAIDEKIEKYDWHGLSEVSYYVRENYKSWMFPHVKKVYEEKGWIVSKKYMNISDQPRLMISLQPKALCLKEENQRAEEDKRNASPLPKIITVTYTVLLTITALVLLIAL